jgi:hypothetical protein
MQILRTVVPVDVNKVGSVNGTYSTVVECHIGVKMLKPDGSVLVKYNYYNAEGELIKEGEGVSIPTKVTYLFDLIKDSMPDIKLGWHEYNDLLFLNGTKLTMMETFPELTLMSDIDIVEFTESVLYVE